MAASASRFSRKTCRTAASMAACSVPRRQPRPTRSFLRDEAERHAERRFGPAADVDAERPLLRGKHAAGQGRADRKLAAKRQIVLQNFSREAFGKRKVFDRAAVLRGPGVNGEFSVHVRRGGDDGFRAEGTGQTRGQRVRAADVAGEERNDEACTLVEAQNGRVRLFITDEGRDAPHRDAAGADKDQRVHIGKGRAIDRSRPAAAKPGASQPGRRIAAALRLRQSPADAPRPSGSPRGCRQRRRASLRRLAEFGREARVVQERPQIGVSRGSRRPRSATSWSGRLPSRYLWSVPTVQRKIFSSGHVALYTTAAGVCAS